MCGALKPNLSLCIQVVQQHIYFYCLPIKISFFFLMQLKLGVEADSEPLSEVEVTVLSGFSASIFIIALVTDTCLNLVK